MLSSSISYILIFHKSLKGISLTNSMVKREIYFPERHQKGWGYEDWIVNNEKYCGKILHFQKGKKCSIHYHELKDETFYLIQGKLEVLVADSPDEYEKGNIKKFILNQGECLHLWSRRIHQMLALEDSKLIEISTQHFEDDSYRIVKGD